MASTNLAADLLVLNSPERDTLQQRVYLELRQALMGGRLLPGRSMTIRAVAAALGTSPMPVREAFRQLAAEHALEMLPNRSFGIPTMTTEQLEDLRQIRAHIEGFAAAEAARLDGPALAVQLTQINAKIIACVETRDREGFFAANQTFHFSIYRAAGSAVMLPIIEMLWLRAGPYLNLLFPEPGTVRYALRRHDEAIHAICHGNGPGAHDAIANDISDAAAVIKAAVTQTLPAVAGSKHC